MTQILALKKKVITWSLLMTIIPILLLGIISLIALKYENFRTWWFAIALAVSSTMIGFGFLSLSVAAFSDIKLKGYVNDESFTEPKMVNEKSIGNIIFKCILNKKSLIKIVYPNCNDEIIKKIDIKFARTFLKIIGLLIIFLGGITADSILSW